MLFNNEQAHINALVKMVESQKAVIESQKAIIAAYEKSNALKNELIELNKQDKRSVQAQEVVIESQKAYIASLEAINKSQENMISIMESIAKIDEKTIQLLREQNVA
jgi:signal recognition particle receptor subunit beta